MKTLLLTCYVALVNFQPAEASQDLRQDNNPEKVVNNHTRLLLTSNTTCKTPFSVTNFMQLGSRGDRVCQLQIQLNNWGFPLNRERELKVNGIFDAQTRKAVLDFQKYYGLKQDGIVGLETSQILSSPRVSGLIRLLKHKDPNLRIRGSYLLREMGTRISNSLAASVYSYSGFSRVGEGDIQSPDVKAAIPDLVALLNDKNTDVRLSAADTLRWISSKSVPALAIPTLIELLQDKNPKVREAAVITLNFILPDAATIAVDPVIKRLDDKDPKVILYAFGFLKDIDISINPQIQAAVEPLIKILENKNDPSPESLQSQDIHLRAHAANLLGNLKAEAAVDSLIKSLQDNDVRTSAAEALAKIKVEAAINPLIELLEDKDKSVRANAALVLGNIKAEAAINPLIKLLEDEDYYVRATAVEALSNIKAEAAVDSFIKLLEDENSNIRAKAVEALGNIKAQAAVNPILNYIEKESDFTLRKSAIEALSNINPQVAVDYLMKLLKNQDDFVRIMAVELLGNMQAQAAVEPLIVLLEDKSEYVRASAAKALGNIQAQMAAEPLIKLLEKKDEYTRTNVVDALGNIKAKSAIEPLLKVLAKNNKSIRENVLKALENIIKSQTTVEPHMIQLLENKNVSLRASVAEALGNTKAQAAIEPLMKHLKNKNEDWEVRLNAFAALAKIGSKAEATIDPIVKLFVVEALQENHPKNYSPEYTDFYGGMPAYKRRALFFTTIEPGTLPSLSKALREILTSKDYDYKVRYSAAFILGYLDSSTETMTTLKSVVSNTSEDFDIRWMSAFSLAKLGQDMNQFFTTNNLINPIQVICPTDNVLDPFTGWCESETGGGAGVEGWAEIFQRMLGRRKKN